MQHTSSVETAAPTEVVAVTAPHCPACAAMAPTLAECRSEFAATVDVVELDASRDTDGAAALGVRATPTFIAMSDGREVGRIVGRVSAAELTRLFDGSAGDAVGQRISTGDRVTRLMAAGVVGAGGALAAEPALFVLAGALIIGATYDRIIRPRSDHRRIREKR